MSQRKIVLIGAGSVKFTQGLLADLIQSPTPWKLCLVDIDPQALETAEGLARRMVQAKQTDVFVEASTDRCDLLPGRIGPPRTTLKLLLLLPADLAGQAETAA